MPGRIRNAASAVDHAADEVAETADAAEMMFDRFNDLIDDFRQQGYLEFQFGKLGFRVRIMLPEQR